MCGAVHHDGLRVATACEKTVAIWLVTTGACICRVELQTGVADICDLPQSQSFCVVESRNVLKVLCAESARRTQTVIVRSTRFLMPCGQRGEVILASLDPCSLEVIEVLSGTCEKQLCLV